MLSVVPALEPGRPLRLLCLGAHSDDIEIGCGGTVLELLAAHPGSVVHWAVFSATGEREDEARASAAAFLAAAGDRVVTVHDFRDGYLPYEGAAVKDAFEKLKVDAHPDLVLTHHERDAHQDHRLVCELTWNTFRDHLILEYEVPKYDGDLGRPNVFVPLADETADRKVALLERHFPSQRRRRWFDGDTFRAVLRLRGVEAGGPERYAEAFYGRKVTLPMRGGRDG